MTHDELTIRIIELSGDDTKNWKFYPALRAVVQLHKPVQSYMFDEEACSHCSSEEDRIEILYPCATIQAIEKELSW
jgi:hypothetical protein